jgi:hypothetical protein
VSALGLGVLILPGPCWAWGEIGHRAVGAIAEKRLTPQARARIQSFMGTETLARASTKADEFRSDPRFDHWSPWHFVEIPLGREAYDLSLASREGDLIQILMESERRLALWQRMSPELLREAMRQYVHFLGDLHMPLHVGNGVDRGGNWCEVLWFRKPTNLHSVWDDDIIGSLNLSYTEWVSFIDVQPATQTAAYREGSFANWAMESAGIRERLYPLSVGSTKKPGQIETPAERSYCKKRGDQEIPESKVPKIGWEYRYAFRPLLEEQIVKAGIRLGHRLNLIFDKAPKAANSR